MRYLIEGHRAVVLFFLLSGFVLSLPQVRGAGRPAYLPYLVKRICRIYLPYLAALAVAILGCWRFHGTDAYGGWFAQTWSAAPTWKLSLEHVGFVGDYPDAAYNTAFWSLVQEMRISLIFPFFCEAVLRMRWKAAVLLPFLLTAAATMAERRGLLPSHVAWTVHYTGSFILGILLARHRVELEAWLDRLAWWQYGMFALVCAGLYCVPTRLGDVGGIGQLGTDLITSFGAAGMMLLSLCHRHAATFLRGAVPVYLGRVSYSLYLLHGTILFAAAYLVAGRMAFSAMLLPVVALSLLAATGMYAWVEVPSIKLGRRLATRVSGRAEG